MTANEQGRGEGRTMKTMDSLVLEIHELEEENRDLQDQIHLSAEIMLGNTLRIISLKQALAIAGETLTAIALASANGWEAEAASALARMTEMTDRVMDKALVNEGRTEA